jgi:uncharacterized membrane protein SirB2
MAEIDPRPNSGIAMYSTLKLIHVSAAILTISGFILRGVWMVIDSPNLQRRVSKIAPHIIDTVFLLSGIGLIWTLRLPVLNQPWLLTKFIALVVYILLGTVALKRGRTRSIRIAALVLALITFAYIGGVALTKSMGSWLAF